MSLGSQVKKYRTAAGCTYADLEAMSGVSTGNINALEKRNSNRSEHAQALARAFGLSTDQLLDETTDHADQVRSHIAQWRITRAHPQAAPRVSEPPSVWGAYWPFSVTQARAKATLTPDDLQRIDAYILAVIEAREQQQAKDHRRQGNGAP